MSVEKMSFADNFADKCKGVLTSCIQRSGERIMILFVFGIGKDKANTREIYFLKQ